jgi:hypothetical protein
LGIDLLQVLIKRGHNGQPFLGVTTVLVVARRTAVPPRSLHQAGHRPAGRCDAFQHFASPIVLIGSSHRFEVLLLGQQQRRLGLQYRLARSHLRQIGWVVFECRSLLGEDRQDAALA